MGGQGMIVRITLGIAVIALVCGCKTMDPGSVRVTDPKINDAMIACNAGASNSIGVELKAKIAAKLRDESSITAGVKSELRGLFLNDSSIASGDREKIYTQYVDCLTKLAH